MLQYSPDVVDIVDIVDIKQIGYNYFSDTLQSLESSSYWPQIILLDMRRNSADVTSHFYNGQDNAKVITTTHFSYITLYYKAVKQPK